MIDIFTTTTNRPALLRKMLNSLVSTTRKDSYRLTVVRDGDYAVSSNVLNDFDEVDFVLTSNENRGLGPSINAALAHIDSLKRWDNDLNSLTCYVQDDVIFKDGWLEKLSMKYLQLMGPLNLGFASGHDPIEHPLRKKLTEEMILKDWIRCTNLLSSHKYWMSMWPIPKIDIETGRERGRPHDGLGSGVDWHFIRVHENSVCKTGRTNLVMPGLVLHAGYGKSTWLKRDLPESKQDKIQINEKK